RDHRQEEDVAIVGSRRTAAAGVVLVGAVALIVRACTRDSSGEARQPAAGAAAGDWIVNEAPVLSRGDLDSWDGFKVGSPVVMASPRGWLGLRPRARYRMWYRGCHFIPGEYTCGVGHAVSPDGVHWEKTPAPVLELPDARESK